MPEFMVTATWMVKANDVEEAVLAASALLDEGRAAGQGDWSVFEPDGDEWIEYEIEWNEEELPDPDDQTPSGIVLDEYDPVYDELLDEDADDPGYVEDELQESEVAAT